MTDTEWAQVRPLLPVPAWLRGRGGQPEAYCHRQIRNNPRRGETGVFNGSSGTITALGLEAHQLTVTFTDGEAAAYPFTDLDELVHAYALTFHRSQDSEYPYVVIPVIKSAGPMLLQRSLSTPPSPGPVKASCSSARPRPSSAPLPTTASSVAIRP
ncbi:hypothetical protein ACWGQ5_54710 [Streptomyces sp. NPDC055722]